MTKTRIDRRFPNYIRSHRRRVGLSQRELGLTLGYSDEGSISRHEGFHATPPLEVAIGYEIVFRVPVSEIFAGLRDEVGEEVEARLARFEKSLGRRSARNRGAIAVAQKLIWLCNRKDIEPGAVP